MANDLPVALDGMGGDHGAAPNVGGAIAAVREDGASVILVGDEATLKREIEAQGANDLLGERLMVRHAPEVVAMDEKPSQAVRKKKGSSLRVACDLVKQGEAGAALSAGNSGAMMAVALFVFGRIDGVIRPAIATAFASPRARTGFAVLIDAGANTDCTPEQLLQFGIMGDAFLRSVYQHPSPVVGVMSNGTEDTKGTDLTRGAVELLRKTDLNVAGQIEGGDVASGHIDVVVTDGFTGNVMLKTGEAVAHFVGDEIKRALSAAPFFVKLGALMVKSTLRKMAKSIDAREYGAAPLLGLAAPAFISHGSSDAYAMRRAIGAARQHAVTDVTGQLESSIQRWLHLTETPPAPSSKQA